MKETGSGRVGGSSTVPLESQLTPQILSSLQIPQGISVHRHTPWVFLAAPRAGQRSLESGVKRREVEGQTRSGSLFLSFPGNPDGLAQRLWPFTTPTTLDFAGEEDPVQDLSPLEPFMTWVELDSIGMAALCWVGTLISLPVLDLWLPLSLGCSGPEIS